MRITWLINEPRYFFFLKASKLVVGKTKGFLRGKALSVEGHIHDDRYYTEAEMNTKLNNKFNYDASRDTNIDMNTLISQGITGIMYNEGTNQTNLHTPFGETTSGYSTITYYNVETISYSSGARLCQIAYSCLSHNPGMWYRIKHDANWRKWNKVSIDGHTHDASQIASGTLPVSRGGTGVTSIDALKNVLGIGSSSGGAINAKFVAGIYNGTYPDQSTQTITVSALTSLYGVLILNPDGGTYYNRGSGADMYLGGMASTIFSTAYIDTITPGTNTFTVTSRSSNYGAVSLNSGPHYYFAFGT